jgi:4-hydroxy-2-oxoheptanedioate aldolase
MTGLKAKLGEGRTVTGCFVKHPSPGIVEVIAFLGWDFVVVDAEHGPIDRLSCENVIRAAETGGSAAVVRVPSIERAPILQALDSGAEGIQAPLVGSRADAEAAVALAKYAPAGTRGLASVRALSYGLVGSMAENVARANERSLVVCQIETAAGLDALDGICAVPGVDVVFVGPTDLGQSLGVVGQREHPDLVAAIDRIAETVLEAGKVFGILVGDEADAVEWQRRGARYLCFNIEGLLRASSQRIHAAVGAGGRQRAPRERVRS